MIKIKKLVIIFAVAGVIIASPFIVRNFFGPNFIGVDIAFVSQRLISPSILASGFLAHEEEVMLSSEVIGKVADLMIEEGDSVRAGDLVLQVDDESFLAGLEQSEAAVRINTIDIERQEVRIKNLERQAARSKSLFEQSLVGEQEVAIDAHEWDLCQNAKSPSTSVAQH